jgi:hypothetical protein
MSATYRSTICRFFAKFDNMSFVNSNLGKLDVEKQ